jgi:hypothetical protein
MHAVLSDTTWTKAHKKVAMDVSLGSDSFQEFFMSYIKNNSNLNAPDVVIMKAYEHAHYMEGTHIIKEKKQVVRPSFTSAIEMKFVQLCVRRPDFSSRIRFVDVVPTNLGFGPLGPIEPIEPLEPGGIPGGIPPIVPPPPPKPKPPSGEQYDKLKELFEGPAGDILLTVLKTVLKENVPTTVNFNSVNSSQRKCLVDAGPLGCIGGHAGYSFNVDKISSFSITPRSKISVISIGTGLVNIAIDMSSSGKLNATAYVEAPYLPAVQVFPVSYYTGGGEIRLRLQNVNGNLIITLTDVLITKGQLSGVVFDPTRTSNIGGAAINVVMNLLNLIPLVRVIQVILLNSNFFFDITGSVKSDLFSPVLKNAVKNQIPSKLKEFGILANVLTSL